MLPCFHASLGTALLLLVPATLPVSAQTPEPAATAPLREVHAEGEKFLTEVQVIAITGLVPGAQIGKGDLQSAADKLVQSGLFAKVSYNFQTKMAGVLVTYHVEESPRIPVYFDNIPWLPDSALAEAIRAKFPFFEGTLPEAGAAVDEAVDAVKELLASRGVQGSLEHTVIANPSGEGNVQKIHIEGAALQIAKLEFSDPSLKDSKAVQQHLSEILGKPYSRMAIDLFLSEAIKPIYLQQGYLRAKLSPDEVRIEGEHHQKMTSQIPVYISITGGKIYQ
jgi:outer membrane protein assembly factor BamA